MYEVVDLGLELARVLAPVAVDLPARADPDEAVGGDEVRHRTVGTAQLGVITAVHARYHVASRELGWHDPPMRLERPGHQDSDLDGRFVVEVQERVSPHLGSLMRREVRLPARNEAVDLVQEGPPHARELLPGGCLRDDRRWAWCDPAQATRRAGHRRSLRGDDTIEG